MLRAAVGEEATVETGRDLEVVDFIHMSVGY